MILDIFKYFAKFPLQSGVLKAFITGTSTIDGYSALRTYVSDMDIHSLIPQVTEYLIGSSSEQVRNRMNEAQSIFMLVDYGKISSERDNRQTINDSFEMAITIAAKLNDSDLVERAIISQNMLNHVSILRAIMEADQSTTSWLKNIDFSTEVVPFDAPDYQALGWTLYFSRKGQDLLSIKDKINAYKK